jgi:hypothetical protein
MHSEGFWRCQDRSSGTLSSENPGTGRLRLEVDQLPSGATPKPVWPWWSKVDATPADVDRMWQAFLRRFDIEHTFRLFEQTVGWTSPKVRTPQAADRWTWLILAAYTQLRLARPLAADLRRPWEKPAPGRSGCHPPATHRLKIKLARPQYPPDWFPLGRRRGAAVVS